MKKTLSLLVLILALKFNVLAIGFTHEGIAYTITSSVEPYTVSVTSNTTEYIGDVVIPEQVTYEGITYAVTEIAGWAFYYNTGLTSITIPNSVKTIGPVSFPMCTGLKNLSIPNSVISIGDNAFSSCSGLLTAEFGSSLTAIGINAFYGCNSLTSVSFGKAISDIGLLAFANCISIVNISVSTENPYLTAENNVLYYKDLTKLILWPGGNTNVIIPNSVTAIGKGAFSNYTNLQTVSLPSSITTIEKYAFNSCTGLKTVSIPNVTTIGSVAFSGCNKLTSITLPNSLIVIEDLAFLLCRGLTEIEIPSSVTTIGHGAFSDCENLQAINVSPSNTTFSTFDGVLYEKGNIKLKACPGGKTKVEFPSTLRVIESSAFEFCTKLANISLPNSLNSIGDNAFYNCNGLKTIICNAVNPPELGFRVFESVPKDIPLYVPIGSVELYSTAEQWKDFVIVPNLFYVTFNTQGGTPISDISTSYNTKITEPIIPTKTGYIFAGWFKEETCTNAWNFDSDLVTTNTTLYAKWTVNTYTVTFNPQGGSSISNVTASYNSTITAPLAPTRTGYTFDGWYKEAGCFNPWTFATDVVTSDITLYAKWNLSSDIETISGNNFKLYPNPAINNLSIEGENIEEITIYSLIGAKVLQPTINSNEDKCSFSIDVLESGIYFARIKTSGNKMTTIKFMKR